MLNHLFKFCLILAFTFYRYFVHKCPVCKRQSLKRVSLAVLITAAIKAAGKMIFAKTCSPCHSKPADPKTPSLTVLVAHGAMQVILNALNNGKMKPQASALTQAQREAVAQRLYQTKCLKQTSIADRAYTKFSLPAKGNPLNDYSGWGGNLEGTGYRTPAQAGITPANV